MPQRLPQRAENFAAQNLHRRVPCKCANRAFWAFQRLVTRVFFFFFFFWTWELRRVIEFVLWRCRHGVDGGCHLPRLALGLPAERKGGWRGGGACHECEA